MAQLSYDKGHRTLILYEDFRVLFEERMALVQENRKPDYVVDPEIFQIRENFIKAVSQNFRQTPSEYLCTSGWGPNINQFAHVSAVLNVSWADWIAMDEITQRALFETVNERIEAQNREQQKSTKELEMKLQSIQDDKGSPFDALRSWNHA
jgi:hypothetical protein